MFNLLIFNVDWLADRVMIPKNRVLEHTEQHICDQFSQNDSILLDRLIELPCLFCKEGTENEVAYAGQISRPQITGTSISLEVSLDSTVPPLQNSMIYANRLELGIHKPSEFSRNHWAVKDVDLYRFLLKNMRPRRQSPIVFKIPEHENIDPTLISAMMPFDAGFTPVYNSIRQLAGNMGLQCRRADDFWENPAIIQDVVALIDRSSVVICDCSDKNPNVFYEAGIAHTLGREVILITQNEHDIPFDLRHLRYVKYLNNAEGLATLTAALEGRMRSIF